MWVLFDLGGVVVDVDLNWSRDAWQASTGTSYAEFDRVFLDSGLKEQIDRGETASKDALDTIRELCGTPLEDQQIRDCWTACLQARPRSTQLVHAVSRQAPCAVLSNTDPIHSAWIERNTGIQEAIKRWIYSFQCGHMKPEASIFHFALELLEAEPKSTLLIDDRSENIDAAHRLGMDVLHYTSFQSVVNGLIQRDLLPSGWTPSLES